MYLLELPVHQLTGEKAKGYVNGKEATFYFLVEVDETVSTDTLFQLAANPSVLAFTYQGTWERLHSFVIPNLTSFQNKPLLVRKSFHGEGSLFQFVQLMLHRVGGNVRLVVELPAGYHDMHTIHQCSEMYPSVSFVGGYFLHLPTCRLGELQLADYPFLIPEKKRPLTSEGFTNYLPKVATHEVLGLDFSTDTQTYRQKEPTEKTNPRVLTNLFDLL